MEPLTTLVSAVTMMEYSSSLVRRVGGDGEENSAILGRLLVLLEVEEEDILVSSVVLEKCWKNEEMSQKSVVYIRFGE